MSAFRAWSLPPEMDEPTETRRVVCDPGGSDLVHPVLAPGEVRGVAARLRAAREAALLERPVASIAEALGRVGRRFLDPDDELRREAVDALPGVNGISPAMARLVVDGMARDWTEERLGRLLEAELGDPAVLDGFREDRRVEGRRIRALGPGLSLHVSAGTVPGVSVTSLIRGLLVKSAVLVKPGRGDAVLPVLFARGLREEDPELSGAVAVTYWPGGEAAAEDEALEEADLVVAYGSDATLAGLRGRCPPTSRFVAYRHRLSFAMLGRDALAGPESASDVAGRAARAVAVFDQRGCVSPHLAYVERGGAVDPEEWARELAGALERLEEELPSGPLRSSEASGIQQVRGTAELEAAAGRGAVHHGGSEPWTVLVEPEPGFRPSCLGRVLRVRPVDDLDRGVREAREVGDRLQTVALEGVSPDRRRRLAEALARAGASRITTLERTPWPPAWWHHDGMGALGILVRWIDLEGE